MRLVLFDVDGTLVNIPGAGRRALRSAMQAVYRESGPIHRHDFRGKTDPSIVRELLWAVGWDDAAIERGLERVWEPYLTELARELEKTPPEPCPGVPTLLDRLEADERFVLGLLTGNIREAAERKLHAAGLSVRFSVGAFGCDSERRDDLPPFAIRRANRFTGSKLSPAHVTILGDTPADVRCARANGTRSLAVATGGHSLQGLRATGADLLFEDLSDTDAVLDALLMRA